MANEILTEADERDVAANFAEIPDPFPLENGDRPKQRRREGHRLLSLCGAEIKAHGQQSVPLAWASI